MNPRPTSAPAGDAVCDFSILRELRKRGSLSIAEVAERSGVSASVISKLERNRTAAELDTLYRLARVFGMTLSDLISLAEGRTAHLVAEERYRSGGFAFRRVAYGNIRCMAASAPKGARLSTPELHKDDYELLWVRKGRIAFHLPNEDHILEAGMSIQFDALISHTYEVLEECELFIAHIRKGKRF